MLELIQGLKNNDGFTVKKNEVIRYKSGWQVGLKGIERKTAKGAARIMAKYPSCGIWYSEGIYYIDICKRVSTKKEALEIGKAHKQQSIYNWKNGKLAWC